MSERAFASNFDVLVTKTSEGAEGEEGAPEASQDPTVILDSVVDERGDPL